MKKLFILTAMFMTLFIITLSTYANASAYQVNFSSTSTSGQTENAAFIVNTLKYEPYPVNAGEWFDLWIQVQNAGQKDALNSKFEIITDYPFSSIENTTQTFNIISGTINANKNLKPGEQAPQENVVVLKYRIKLADNANEGTNILKFKTSISGTNEHTYELPISVDKTKTNFELSMRDSTARRTTFSIANTGEKPASAITVKVKDDSILIDKTAANIILGTLNIGEFSTVSFPILPNDNLHNITFEIGYTDASGVRTTFEKTVPVTIAKQEVVVAASSSALSQTLYEKYSNWIYGVIGLILGLTIMALISRRKK